MEIKKCPFCGGESMIESSITDSGLVSILNLSRHRVCCDDCGSCSGYCGSEWEAIDVWNGRVEENPSEADRWLAEATEQRARAELAVMQRDEFAEALEKAKKMLAYSGKLQ